MNEENLNKKIKTNKIIIASLIIILVIILIVVLINHFGSKNTKNNNDSNMGMVVSGDNYTFYYKYNENNGELIKVQGNEEYKIAKGQAYSLCYDNGFVYYTTIANNGIEVEIRKVNQNGETNELITTCNTNSTKMYLDDGYLYYTTTNPSTIERIDINGKNRSVVLTRTISDFKVSNGTIYFTDYEGFLYKVDTNGENNTKIGNDVFNNKFQLLNNYAYYYEEGNGLIKMNLRNYKKEKVSDKVNSEVFNVTKDAIYFYDIKSKAICSISLNNKNYKEIVKVKTANTRINVVGSTLYYLEMNEDESSYRTHRIKVNGKKLKDVEY